MMHVRVRINYGNKDLPFTMTVTGARHRGDFMVELVNMDAAWTAARKVSEVEQDHRVKTGPGC